MTKRLAPQGFNGSSVQLSREDLAAALDAVSDPITVQQADGRLVWANAAAARQLGYDTPEELVAAPTDELMGRFTLFDERGEPFPVERLPGRLALTGVETPEILVRWRTEGSEDERWSLVRAAPVFDEQGRVRFAVNLFRDDTVRQHALRALQRSESRLAFMASASRALLRASLDPAEIAERLTELCVPALGDRCAIWQPDLDGRLRRIAARTTGASGGYPEPEEPPHLVSQALAGQAGLSAGTEEQGASVMAAPIPGRTGPLGAILVAREGPRPPLSPDDLELLEQLCRRAGVAMENALLYEERSRAAAVLSRSLVPAELPEVPGLDLYAFVRAAASGVGGDFYDVVSLGDGRSLLVIADVCGKGPEAAALTAMARYTLRTLSRHYASPAELLKAVNEALVDQLPDGKFCSLACGALGPSPSGIRVTVAVAGHPKPLILRQSGSLESCGETGFPLGVFYRLELEERDVLLEPGDSFLLVTDGCVGEGGAWQSVLNQALESSFPRSAKELAGLVERVALGVQPDHPDDIAALVARFPERSATP